MISAAPLARSVLVCRVLPDLLTDQSQAKKVLSYAESDEDDEEDDPLPAVVSKKRRSTNRRKVVLEDDDDDGDFTHGMDGADEDEDGMLDILVRRGSYLHVCRRHG